jgi:hypothetical protein
MALTREDFIVQSVEEYLKARLAARGYKKDDQFVLLDSWTGGKLPSPLGKTHIAAGFDFDDGGRAAEIGSSLMVRVYRSNSSSSASLPPGAATWPRPSSSPSITMA